MTEAIKFYHKEDAPGKPLGGERVAVLGYGNLGRTAALNLRDSGVSVKIGNREDDYADLARKEGFEVLPIAEASKADVIYVLLPDEVIPEVFPVTIKPSLGKGSAIAFGSGYTLAYKLIAPPEDVDVIMVAPRMAGETARKKFVEGGGFWAYIGVERDASGKASGRMLGLAAGIGSLRVGALQMTAEMESILDLFIEQSVGPLMGLSILTAFTIGVQEGIPAEALVLEMYMSGEFETVFQSFRENGIFKASQVHGPSALFGGIIRTLEIDQAELYRRFHSIFKDIREGSFARRFQEESAAGYPMLKVALQMNEQYPEISKAEEAVRKNGK